MTLSPVQQRFFSLEHYFLNIWTEAPAETIRAFQTELYTTCIKVEELYQTIPDTTQKQIFLELNVKEFKRGCQRGWEVWQASGPVVHDVQKYLPPN